MHESCKIAPYVVLLSDADGDILLFPVGVHHVKNTRITFSTSRVCFIAVHVCSGKMHFYDLQNFNLETCIEKPEVDIMMPSLVSEAKVIFNDNVTKNECHIQLTTM